MVHSIDTEPISFDFLPGFVAAGAEHAADVPPPPEDALDLRRHLPPLHPLPLLRLRMVRPLQRLHQVGQPHVGAFFGLFVDVSGVKLRSYLMAKPQNNTVSNIVFLCFSSEEKDTATICNVLGLLLLLIKGLRNRISFNEILIGRKKREVMA